MYATRGLSRKSIIRDFEKYLLWRRRTFWKPFIAFFASFLAGGLFIMPKSLGWAVPGADSLAWVGFCFFCLGVVFGGIGMYIELLDTRDLNVLLETDSVLAIPAIAEYYHSFGSRGRGTKGCITAPALRERIVELLRAQSETPSIPFSRFGICCLIHVVTDLNEVAGDQRDRRLLLNVVAQAGSPACLRQLDYMVWKVCREELKKDEQAKHNLRRMVLECKNTIRDRSSGVKEAQSLLRASDLSHGLLRPTSPSRTQDKGENLLRASVQRENQDAGPR